MLKFLTTLTFAAALFVAPATANEVKWVRYYYKPFKVPQALFDAHCKLEIGGVSCPDWLQVTWATANTKPPQDVKLSAAGVATPDENK
jgi:hypothetical protein